MKFVQKYYQVMVLALLLIIAAASVATAIKMYKPIDFNYEFTYGE